MSLALDGHVSTSGGGSSKSVSLSTANANVVIVVFVMTGAGSSPPTVSSISDGLGLTWTQRAQQKTASGAGASGWWGNFEAWYAVSSGALSSDSITVTLTASATTIGVQAFGISGANTASPFDGNASLPATNNNTGGGVPSVVISTSNANDMLICVDGAHNGQGAPTGFTALDTVNSGSTGTYGQADSYEIVSATQSSVTVSAPAGVTGQGVIIVDAVQAAGAAPQEEAHPHFVGRYNPASFARIAASSAGEPPSVAETQPHFLGRFRAPQLARVAFPGASDVPPAPAQPVYRAGSGASVSSNGGSGTSAVVTPGVAQTAGDLMIVSISAVIGNPGTVTAPAGWTQLSSSFNASAAVYTGVWYKIAGGAEPSTYSWSWTNSTHNAWAYAAYSGCDPVNPIDAFADQFGTTAGTTLTYPSVAASYPTDVWVTIGMCGAGGSTGQSLSAPAGFSSRTQDDTSASAGASIAIFDEDLSASGPTGTTTSALANSATQGGVSIALQGSAAAPLVETQPHFLGRFAGVSHRLLEALRENRAIDESGPLPPQEDYHPSFLGRFRPVAHALRSFPGALDVPAGAPQPETQPHFLGRFAGVSHRLLEALRENRAVDESGPLPPQEDYHPSFLGRFRPVAYALRSFPGALDVPAGAPQPETQPHFIGRFRGVLHARFLGNAQAEPPPVVDAPPHFLGRFNLPRFGRIAFSAAIDPPPLVQDEYHPSFIGRFTDARHRILEALRQARAWDESGLLPLQPETEPHFLGRFRTVPFTRFDRLLFFSPTDAPLFRALVPTRRYGAIAPTWRFGAVTPRWRIGAVAPSWRFGVLVPGYARMPFVADTDAVSPGVPQTVWIDFGNLLPPGTTLSAPTASVAIYEGEDPAPGAIVSSGPVIGTVPVSVGGTGIANTSILVQITPPVPSVKYSLRLNSDRSDCSDKVDGLLRVPVGPAEP